MELSAHVWKSVAACAHKEDDMKQTKMTWIMTGLRIICWATLAWKGWARMTYAGLCWVRLSLAVVSWGMLAVTAWQQAKRQSACEIVYKERRETCDQFCKNNSATSKPNLKPFSPGTPNKQQLQVHYAQVTRSNGKNSKAGPNQLQNFSPTD